MGLAAKAKRAALGAKYIGKHGTQLRHKTRQAKNRRRKLADAKLRGGA